MNQARRILLVDDDEQLRDLYARALQEEGFEVSQAGSGGAALQVAREVQPGLVLLDVTLPDLSGLEVCRQLKLEPALSGVLIALISGAAVEPEHKVAGLDTGADDYILKPVALRELLARVRTLGRLREATLALRDSEERYRQLAENIREVFWMTDVHKKQMLYISPAYEAIWGRSCASLYASPRDWMSAIHPEDQERVRASALTRQSSGEYDELYRIVRPDGTIRWIQDRAFPVRDERGVVYRVVGIAEDITKRKQAEEALQESQARTRAAEAQLMLLGHAVESTTEPICITDLQDRFVFVNRAFERTYGYTQEEVLGKRPEILFSPRNPTGLKATILEQARLGSWQGELWDVRKDGSEFPIRLSTSQIKDPEGRVIGLMGVAQDITERKRAEAQIRLLADAVHSTNEIICVTDTENRIKFVNEAALRAYGYAREEMLGRTPDFLYSPNNPAGLCEQVFRLKAQGGWHGEILGRRKDGTEFPLSLSTSQIKDAEGRTAGYLGVGHDITERKRQEKQRMQVAEALLAAETRYRSIFEHATEGIFQTTPDGRLLDANPALVRILGYASAEEMIGAITDVAWQIYVRPQERLDLKQLLEARGVVEGFEAENYRKDGSRIWISLNAHAVRDETKTVVRYEGTLQDITERKRLEQQLLEISASERRRIGHELHDGLGQYLAGIAFRAKALEQVLAREGSRHTGRAKELTTLVSNAIRQTRSVARGLDPIQVETSGLPAALQNLATEVTQFFCVSCVFQCAEAEHQVHAQTGLTLYRLTQEAVHNAIRHGEAKCIEIGLTRTAEHLVLRIRDNGLGFNVTARRQSGMGLRVMEYRAGSIGARLAIDSKLKRGTEIRCEVPLSRCLVPPQGAGGASSASDL